MSDASSSSSSSSCAASSPRQVILASASGSRRRLLEDAGVAFVVAPADLDERPLPHERVEDRARRLALAKATEVAALHPGAIVIGGDQIGYLPATGRKLDKCMSVAEAHEQLGAMSGQTHVFRSAAVVLDDGRLVGVAEELAEVTFHALTPSQIKAYLATDEWRGTCGGYRLEGEGARSTVHARPVGRDLWRH